MNESRSELQETDGGAVQEQHPSAYQYYTPSEAKALLDRKLPRTDAQVRRLVEATSQRDGVKPVLTSDEADGLKVMKVASFIVKSYSRLFDPHSGRQELINMAYDKICYPSKKPRRLPRDVSFGTAMKNIMMSITDGMIKRARKSQRVLVDLAEADNEAVHTSANHIDIVEVNLLRDKMLVFAASIEDDAERILLEGYLTGKIEGTANPHEIAHFLGEAKPDIQIKSLITRMRRHIEKEFSGLRNRPGTK